MEQNRTRPYFIGINSFNKINYTKKKNQFFSDKVIIILQ